MVQHSDNSYQKNQEDNCSKKNYSNGYNSSCKKGGLVESGHLQISPNGHDSPSFFNNGNNNNNINKAENKQTVGDGGSCSCCGCSCGITKSFKTNVKDEEMTGEDETLPGSPTISSSSSSISHGRHLPHRKSNNHSLDADLGASSFSSSQPSFFSRFGSSVYSANSFLWFWFSDRKEKQNSNYSYQKDSPQFSSQDYQLTSSVTENAKQYKKKDSTQESILSFCHSFFPLSFMPTPQSLLLSNSSTSTSSTSSLMPCRLKNSRNCNNINAPSESDGSSGISTASSDRSSSIKKLSSIKKKSRKRSKNIVFEGNSKNNQFLAASSFFLQSFLFLVCIFIFWNSLYCDFVFDDITAIKENKDLRPHIPMKNLFYNDFWGTPMTKEQSHKSYRPLTVLTFRFNYFLGGLDPIGYHLINIILHGIVTLLYYNYLMCVTSEVISFMAALMFALHPVSPFVLYCSLTNKSMCK